MTFGISLVIYNMRLLEFMGPFFKVIVGMGSDLGRAGIIYLLTLLIFAVVG